MTAAVTPTIDHLTLTRLVEAGAVRGASVIGQPGGWGVVIECGVTARTLAAKRGAARVFRKFETLVGYLKGMGIFDYRVDASGFDPIAFKTLRTRSDAAARMKSAHDASAYTAWLAGEVQAAIDDDTPSVPQAEVQSEWALERAALLQLAHSNRSAA